MPQHPAVERVIRRIGSDEIGGAADTAKEIVGSLAILVGDSSARVAEDLAREVEDAAIGILRVMPSLAPPLNALHRVMGSMEESLRSRPTVQELRSGVGEMIDGFLLWAETALDKVAQYGAERIRDGDIVFTYSMSSTVWRIFGRAQEQGKSFSVMVTESRPSNEGLWTVTEMEKSNIPVSISIDACVGELVSQCNSVFVGADAISSHGVSLCKAGTYPTALVAKAHGTPFYVAADTLKLDTSTLLGFPFKKDGIPRQEVLGTEYSDRVKVVGHLFDETPPHLVTAIITEVGLLSPTACLTVMQNTILSERLSAIIPSWIRGEL